MSIGPKYNGRASYETWLAFNWATIDAASLHAYRDECPTPDALREYVESQAATRGVYGSASIVADLFNAALGRVDWQELYDDLRDEGAP